MKVIQANSKSFLLTDIYTESEVVTPQKRGKLNKKQICFPCLQYRIRVHIHKSNLKDEIWF